MNLLDEIKKCRLCEGDLPFSPNPVVVLNPKSPYLIVGQAPGIKVHQTLRPWNDASGERLRDWLKISPQDLYNPELFSIVPMGFCYPGKAKTGDLPPRKECSIRWMDSVLCELKSLTRIILVGSYSTHYFLGPGSLDAYIQEHARNDSLFVVLPHPSPRNNIWLKKNDWFEQEALHLIRKKLNFTERP